MANKKIRVLYVEENRDGTVGGSHYCLIDLIKVLDKEKFEPITMFYEPNVLEDAFREVGSEVVIYKKPLGINLMKFMDHWPLKIFKPLPFVVRIPQMLFNIFNTNIIPFFYIIYFLLRYKIQIVHMNDTVFSGLDWVFAAKLTGKKIIGHERGYHETIPPYGLPNTAFHTKYYDFLLGMSLSVKKNLERLGVPLERYATFYDRTDMDAFKKRIKKTPEDVKKEFKVNHDDILLGIVGNIQRWKGQWAVVEAVHLLNKDFPNLKCLLVGDHSTKNHDDLAYYEELKEKINHYGLNDKIILTGYRTDVPDLVNAMDICIHASTNPEPWGLVVLEAMTLAKPLVAANIGGPVEIIEDGVSGFLVKPGEPELLAEKLLSLIKDEKLRKKIGDNAYRRVKEKFSTLDIQFIEDLYMKLLNHGAIV